MFSICTLIDASIVARLPEFYPIQTVQTGPSCLGRPSLIRSAAERGASVRRSASEIARSRGRSSLPRLASGRSKRPGASQGRRVGDRYRVRKTGRAWRVRSVATRKSSFRLNHSVFDHPAGELARAAACATVTPACRAARVAETVSPWFGHRSWIVSTREAPSWQALNGQSPGRRHKDRR